MNQARFQRVLMSYLAWIWLPFGLLALLTAFNAMTGGRFLGSQHKLFGLPLVAIDGTPNFSGSAGPAFFSFGGFAFGVIAFGGTAVGLIAVGGGACGLISIGGGAIGLLAIGGGALGYIAVGGGACGVYVLAGDGKGKYVFTRKRQDEKAVELFCRWLPRLKDAKADS